jgi:isopenicillin-N epimerase
MDDLKKQFLLDTEVVFLNHGSFGATPRPVFDVYQAWQRRLERQPVKFFSRELDGYFEEARRVLGEYLNVEADDLVYVPNATHGVNVVARSLSLGPGDEVLTTDHEYGACDRTWRFLSQKQGFRYLRQAIPLPADPAEEMVERIWAGVGPQTKLIFISHITSITALRLPVEAICRRARQAGILTFIDGAHAPGQILLDLEALGADFYTGNCHKWMCAPKGAGFLHARRPVQPLLEPLVVSWGWESEEPGDSLFIDHHEWLGTNDPAAYLSVPAAIRFQADHDWPSVRLRCRQLLEQALMGISELTGLPPLYPGEGDFYHQMGPQMGAAELPGIGDPAAFQARLYDQHRVEVPINEWHGRPLIRVSIQGYNTPADVNLLLVSLEKVLSQR